MTSRVTIRRPGASTTDGNDYEVPSWSVVAADLPCRVSGVAGSASPTHRVTVGAADVEIAARVLHLPAGTTGITDGDYVDVTTGELSGRAFRIVEATLADQQTAVRVPLLEVQRPEEW